MNLKTKAEGIAQFGLGHLYLLEHLRIWFSSFSYPPIADKENHPHVAIIGGGIEE
jgi:hypothetical protein